ncbi:MAG TPA: FHA domain-containing protein, partial [Anaeromyxobacteraceae bacterium]|nr:FHA domain-containing protein [Anaeromyxobacteraceae bacterium]
MRLVIEDEAGTRTVVPFTSDELVLGRAAEGVAWRLPDRNVSRRHCRFARANGAVFVEDLGSLTGTWLNGERISGRRRVRAGDLIEVGDYDLVVLTDQAEAVGPGTPPPLRAAGAARPEPLAPPPVPSPA